MEPSSSLSFFDAGFWQSGPFLIVKAIFVIIDAALVALIAYSIAKAWEFRPKFDFRAEKLAKPATERAKFFKERWRKIMEKFSEGTPDAMRVAIIEADALVEESLKHLSYQGEHFADRLEKLDPGEFSTLDRLWKAHRIRNDLVHVPGFFLAAHDAKAVLDSYEEFLKELKAL